MLLLQSCTININDDILTQKNSRIVVNGIFQNDNPFSVHVSKSTALSDSNIDIISNAKVELFADSLKIDELLFDASTGFYISKKKPVSGILYRLKITTQDGEIVSAQDSLPNASALSNYPVFQATTHYDELNGPSGQVEFSIADIKQTKDYYEVVVGSMSKINDGVNYIDNDNSNWYQETILFPDEKINGKEYHMIIQLSNNKAPEITIKHISESYYKYKKAVYSYQNSQNEDGDWTPFPHNPASMWGNIENGLGIFAGVNISKYNSVTR